MAIPEGWIRANVNTRNSIAKHSANQVEKILADYLVTHPNATEKEINAFAFESIKAVLETQGEAAGALARDAFVSSMENAGEAVDGQLYGYSDVIDEDYLRGHIYKSYRNNFAGKTANVQQFIRAMGEATSSGVNRMHMMNTKLNARANEKRYARIPTGSKTCAWCIMLASRGAVYYSEDKAKRGNHSNCDCIFVAMPAGQYVEGWDGNTWQRMQETMEICGIDPYTQFNEITKEQWARLNALVTQQNTKYYVDGTQGKLICDEATLAFKTRNERSIEIFENEKHSISKLYPFGINGEFQIDEIKIKGKKRVSYADLSGGVEIKTAYKLNSYLSIANQIENSMNKEEVKLIYFDFSENKNASTKDLKKWIQDAKRKHKCAPVLSLFPNETIPVLVF